jgi:hypothetical protein
MGFLVFYSTISNSFVANPIQFSGFKGFPPGTTNIGYQEYIPVGILGILKETISRVFPSGESVIRSVSPSTKKYKFITRLSDNQDG